MLGRTFVIAVLIILLSANFMLSYTSVSGELETILIEENGATNFTRNYSDQPIIIYAKFYNGTSEGNLLYRFDWGDGTVSNWSKGYTNAHEYDRIGLFIVNITIKDSENITCNREIMLTIYQPFPRHNPKLYRANELILLGLVIAIIIIIITIAILVFYRLQKR